MNWLQNSLHSHLVCRLCYFSCNAGTRFAIADTKLYIPVITLWTQDNYHKNSGWVLKEQLTGININLKQGHMHKINI